MNLKKAIMDEKDDWKRYEELREGVAISITVLVIGLAIMLAVGGIMFISNTTAMPKHPVIEVYQSCLNECQIDSNGKITDNECMRDCNAMIEKYDLGDLNE